jgi:uracil-DNA glycosylase
VVPKDATLEQWAARGVLLLNTALTVQEGIPGSHSNDWKAFTDAVLQVLASQPKRIVFMLWGEHAKAYRSVVECPPHKVIASSHPASRGDGDRFKCSRPFSLANSALGHGRKIDWSLA